MHAGSFSDNKSTHSCICTRGKQPFVDNRVANYVVLSENDIDGPPSLNLNSNNASVLLRVRPESAEESQTELWGKTRFQ